MTYTHRTIICTAVAAPTMRELAQSWPGGAGMFQRALTSEGNDEPEAFISSGLFDAGVIDLFPYVSYQTDPPTQHPGNVDLLCELLELPPEHAGDLLAQLDISDQDALAAMARRGLVFLDSGDYNAALSDILAI
jgi:hypothetical protein